ncbi:MAG: hypothetical protein Q4D20_02815 [Clostridia bacterium]|nr:hypothetical protein [Clostridia bacterium]
MKRILAIVFTLLIALGLFACGKEPEDTKATTENSSSSLTTESTSESSTEKVSTELSSETTTTKPAAFDPENLQKGAKGEGPVTIKTPTMTFSVPKGLAFSLDTYSMTEEKPFFGSIAMTFKNSGKKNWGTLRATSIDKFNNLEEASKKALRDTHYDTYENGKYAEEKNVKIGNCTFNVLHVTTDYSEKDYYITFAKRGEKDFYGLFVQLEVNKKYIAADDPVITELLKSISIAAEK